MMFVALRIRAYVRITGACMSSKEWCPPARPPVHWSITVKSGFAAAISTTLRIALTDPGLNET